MYQLDCKNFGCSLVCSSLNLYISENGKLHRACTCTCKHIYFSNQNVYLGTMPSFGVNFFINVVFDFIRLANRHVCAKRFTIIVFNSSGPDPFDGKRFVIYVVPLSVKSN